MHMVCTVVSLVGEFNSFLDEELSQRIWLRLCYQCFEWVICNWYFHIILEALWDDNMFHSSLLW
jgi:hypothetical protein